MFWHDRRGWWVPPGGMSKREGLGILTGFPLAVWQSKLPTAGRNAMSQNLMAQNAFLTRWPPPVSKSKNLPAAFAIFGHPQAGAIIAHAKTVTAEDAGQLGRQ